MANTRVAPGSVISAANVSRLREAWTFTLTGQAAAGVSGVGSLTASPVVRGGVVYLQDEDANVYALALATGKLKWEYQVNVLYVATIDLPITFTSLSSVDGSKAGGPEAGEVEALSLATGKVEWDVRVPALPLGASPISTSCPLRPTRRSPSSATRSWSRRAGRGRRARAGAAARS